MEIWSVYALIKYEKFGAPEARDSRPRREAWRVCQCSCECALIRICNYWCITKINYQYAIIGTDTDAGTGASLL